MRRIVASVILLLSCLLVSSAGAEERAWNLVLIVADDLGWSDLSCYGSDLHQTPELDRFAESSVKFTDAYAASPVCSPTRAALLTGRHPARLHMTVWREAAENRGNRQLLEPVTRGDLPLSETTLAEVLHGAGYNTAHIGKWHLGRAESYPQPHGFDINIGGTLWGAPQTFYHPFRGDQYFRDWRYVPDLEPSSAGDYLTDRLTDKALEIIDQAGEKPFFLNLWYHTVHTPIEGKRELVEKYERLLAIRRDTRQRNPYYAAMVSSLDENVGRVLTKLDEAGIAERTIVIFTSDNGGFINTCKLHPDLPVTTNAPLRSGKGACYEGGIRVPLIVRWPGQTPAGAECSAAVTSCDLFPTILAMLGLQAENEQTLDGVDITPILADTSATIQQRNLFFHFPHYYPTTSPVSAVRSGDWKLLEYFEEGRTELYNLADDVGEQRNLTSTEADRTRQLRRLLHQWRTDIGAQSPEQNPDWQKRD